MAQDLKVEVGWERRYRQMKSVPVGKAGGRSLRLGDWVKHGRALPKIATVCSEISRNGLGILSPVKLTPGMSVTNNLCKAGPSASIAWYVAEFVSQSS